MDRRASACLSAVLRLLAVVALAAAVLPLGACQANGGAASPDTQAVEGVLDSAEAAQAYGLSAESAGDAADAADAAGDTDAANPADAADAGGAAESGPGAVGAKSAADVRAADGPDVVELSGNVSGFTDVEKEYAPFEFYGDLDDLGRCTVAFAMAGPETMPTEKRGDISEVHPSGWQHVEYDFVDGGSLYNRSHLIGHMLTAEDANDRNLITGTRHMNADLMLPYEEEVARYIDRTGNHVLYRVTPVFEGDDLVARGVQMEAWSVEDDGAGVCFNVFCRNVQPGVEIDYATGDSWEAGGEASRSEAEKGAESSAGETASEGAEAAGSSGGAAADDGAGQAGAAEGVSYVVNTRSRKFHDPACGQAANISARNREDFTGTREEAVAQGFEPAGCCEP
ncbi:DNA-entry nuclease [Eggerthellaceae bacterium zg-887]|uniref:DNA/RNA non-specific endonuclease n=1 Tax=Xiamenia xianingshaonis TaxID=2682776 RepID=UPI00140B9D12|nr:DNA/RNA non-specific endonuclease [Xiamenia xianingshaonis]NHM15389.1 DNA-entry nuclease [Xiamenia xianingshaonis]